MRPDIVPGAVFPDYQLPDHRGKRRRLSELQGATRWCWCFPAAATAPRTGGSTRGCCSCTARCVVGYCRLVTLSTDNLIETNEFRTAMGAQWTFLSDAGRRVQKDLDIAEYTDPHHDPMIPHTLVLEPGLRVYRVYGGYWFFGRPTVERQPAPGPARRAAALPPGLGDRRRGAARGLGERGPGGLLPVRQDGGAAVRRAGVTRPAARREKHQPLEDSHMRIGIRDAHRAAEVISACARSTPGRRRRRSRWT